MKPEEFLASLQPSDSTRPFPGAALSVCKQGEVVYHTAGLADIEQCVSISPQSRFHVASLAKQFTAFIVASLIAERKLHMESPATEYLPWLPPALEDVRLRHLLFHTSGIRDQWALAYFAGRREGDQITTGDVQGWLENESALNFIPGSRFLYSNSGYTLLGLIAEQITGREFTSLADDLLFRPLGMTSTGFVANAHEVIPHRVYGYRSAGNAYWRYDPQYGVIGSTCLRTSVEDMGKWLACSVHNEFFAAVRNVGYFEPGYLDDGQLSRYGFGQIITTIAGRDVIMHGGFDYGFNAILVRCADEPSGIFAAANSGFAELETSAIDVFKGLFGTESNHSGHGTKESALLPPNVITGIYSDEERRDVRSIQRLPDGRLWLGWMQGFELRSIGHAEYSVVGTPNVMSFDANRETIEFYNGYELTKLALVQGSPIQYQTLIGDYFSSELRSVITIRQKNDGLTIKVGANDEDALEIAAPDLCVWGAYWARPIIEGERVIRLFVSHPRCTMLEFRRI